MGGPHGKKVRLGIQPLVAAGDSGKINLWVETQHDIGATVLINTDTNGHHHTRPVDLNRPAGAWIAATAQLPPGEFIYRVHMWLTEAPLGIRADTATRIARPLT